LTVVFQDLDYAPDVSQSGTIIIQEVIEVDATGTALSSSWTEEGRTPEGTLEYREASTRVGTRLMVGSMAPLGLPTAGTPTA